MSTNFVYPITGVAYQSMATKAPTIDKALFTEKQAIEECRQKALTGVSKNDNPVQTYHLDNYDDDTYKCRFGELYSDARLVNPSPTTIISEVLLDNVNDNLLDNVVDQYESIPGNHATYPPEDEDSPSNPDRPDINLPDRPDRQPSDPTPQPVTNNSNNTWIWVLIAVVIIIAIILAYIFLLKKRQ